MRVGTSTYCQTCGTRLGGPRTMDIRPATSNAPVMPTDRPAKTAAALHARAIPGNKVLDLRQSATPKATATTTTSATPATPKNTTTPNASRAAIQTGRPHTSPAPAPKTTAKERHLARFEDRYKQAQTVERSQFVSKFDRSNRFGGSRLAVTVPSANPPAVGQTPTPPAPRSQRPELPAATATQHAAMAQLANAGAAHHNHDANWRPQLHLAPRAGQYAAVFAAVVIMGGYIWLQNYPKMAIQSAGNRAGITASLPGYIPSSFVLANTRTSPGLVTLDFTSPSQTEKLTITQHRTTWDSTSLLDQYIANKTPDYTAVQGQGLTVYLYGKNQAAWVNHGVWYSIEGATRLSRDQILKIAYSL